MAGFGLPISVTPTTEWHPRDPDEIAREQAVVEGLRRAQMEMFNNVAKQEWQRYGHKVANGSDLLEAKDGTLYTPREAMYQNIMAKRRAGQIVPEAERPGWENIVSQGHYTYPMLEPIKAAYHGLIDIGDRASSIPEGALEAVTDWANEGVPPINAIEKGIAGVFDHKARPDRDKIYGGLTPINRLVAEIAMDPTNWVGVGALKGGTGAMVRSVDNAAARVAGAIDNARYGRGVRTELVDEAGDMIRRLKNSPMAPSRQPALIEYTR